MRSRSADRHYKGGVFGTLTQVVKEEGVRALFKGNGSNCLRIVPNYALKFSLNDLLRDRLVRRQNQEIKDMSFVQLMAAGTLAGVMQMLVTYPIETVRTRMTLSGSLLPGNVQYTGILQCAAVTVEKEGYGALYKGLVPGLVSGAPYVGMQMTLFELGKNFTKVKEQRRKIVCKRLILRCFPKAHTSLGEIFPGPVVSMMVGACAGVIAQTTFYPGDTVRRRMQANGIAGEKKIYNSALHCVKTIVVKEGFFKGLFGGCYSSMFIFFFVFFSLFFQGCWANVVKAIPGAALQFAVFDFFKHLLRT